MDGLKRQSCSASSRSRPSRFPICRLPSAYILADNKLALNAGWDKEILAIELQGLIDLEFDVEVTGFSLAEIDLVLDEAGDADPEAPDAPEDAVPIITGD